MKILKKRLIKVHRMRRNSFLKKTSIAFRAKMRQMILNEMFHLFLLLPITDSFCFSVILSLGKKHFKSKQSLEGPTAWSQTRAVETLSEIWPLKEYFLKQVGLSRWLLSRICSTIKLNYFPIRLSQY